MSTLGSVKRKCCSIMSLFFCCLTAWGVVSWSNTCHTSNTFVHRHMLHNMLSGTGWPVFIGFHFLERGLGRASIVPLYS